MMGKPAEIIRLRDFAFESLQMSMCDLAAAWEDPDSVERETISKVQGLITGMRPRGPVITVVLNIEREMVEFLKISGDQVCGGVPLSEAPCTDPWDFLQFKPFMKEVIARIPWGDGILDVKHVLDDNGQQLGDAADITGLTRLTIQSEVVFPEALSDAAHIEHCIRTLPDHSLSEVYRWTLGGVTSAHKKCKCDSRDLLCAMAWDPDKDIFLTKLLGAYKGCNCVFDRDVRSGLLVAYSKMRNWHS